MPRRVWGRPLAMGSGFWQRGNTYISVLVFFFFSILVTLKSFYNDTGINLQNTADAHCLSFPCQGLHHWNPASPPLPPLSRGLREQHVRLW